MVLVSASSVAQSTAIDKTHRPSVEGLRAGTTGKRSTLLEKGRNRSHEQIALAHNFD